MSPSSATAPDLLLLIGPPAVGKMTVGISVCELTGFRLLHNHMTIDLVARFFDFGSAPFTRLVESFRIQLLEEIAASDLPGLVLTFVWPFNEPSVNSIVTGYVEPFTRRGGRLFFVELEATQRERLRRNETPLRLEHKAPMRDVQASRLRLLDSDQRFRFNSQGELADVSHHLRIDNTTLPPEAVAARIVSSFGLSNTT